jgi:pseudouridine-5'-phosphate glycosidase
MPPDWLSISEEVQAALAVGQPVVALESTLIAHGLPWPVNMETARESEAAVRSAGAVPATIAVLNGVPTIGLSDSQIEELAQSSGVRKASRRDLGAAVALKQHAATTVSATMALAHAAGIRVFATGGIGGAHGDCGLRIAECGMKTEDTSSNPHSAIRNPQSGEPFDISADLTELARTPVLVVCAGAKSILHLPRTLEILETLGVPVVGYRTDAFPTFYVRGHTPPLPVSARVDSAGEAAALFAAHVRMGGGGAVLTQPCPAEVAVPAAEFDRWRADAERQAHAAGVTGAKVTPFLLARIAELSGGRTLAANRTLIVANAKLAAEVAVELGRPA